MYSAGGNRRITSAGFPHSGIRGSLAIQRLTAAYRSRSRPSSTPGAKASTVCPSYLDGDQRNAYNVPSVIPVRTAHVARAVLRWHDCAVFKVRVEAPARTGRSVSQNSTAWPRRRKRRATQVRSTLGTDGELESGGMPNWPRRRSKSWSFPRKEVIQPHLPVRLPCYDFTPVTSPTFDGSLQMVRPPASGVACFHGVTGGVYKARERIHRGNADPRLLATPPSCRRVSACNPNRDAL